MHDREYNSSSVAHFKDDSLEKISCLKSFEESQSVIFGTRSGTINIGRVRFA